MIMITANIFKTYITFEQVNVLISSDLQKMFHTTIPFAKKLTNG